MNDRIRKLVSKNKIEEAIKELENEFPNNKEIALIHSRFNQVKANKVKGVISNENLNLELNLIRSDLLDLAENINKGLPESNIFSKERKIFVWLIILGLCLLVILSYNKIKHLMDSRENDLITLTYGRLFGGYQVPIILSTITFGRDEKNNSNYPSCNSAVTVGDISLELIQFWDNLEFNDANIVKTKPLDELFDCSKSEEFWGTSFPFYKILHIANKHNPKIDSLFYYQSDELYYQGTDIPIGVNEGTFKSLMDFTESDDRTQKEVWEQCIKNSDRVGFLILLLENNSGNNLLNVEIEYVENLVNHWEISDAKKVNQILESEIKKNVKTKSISSIANSDKFLMLLSVYLKDENGYPSEYLSSVIRPIKMKYKIQGTNEIYSQNIRLPLKDKAFKKYIPFGWLGQ